MVLEPDMPRTCSMLTAVAIASIIVPNWRSALCVHCTIALGPLSVARSVRVPAPSFEKVPPLGAAAAAHSVEQLCVTPSRATRDAAIAMIDYSICEGYKTVLWRVRRMSRIDIRKRVGVRLIIELGTWKRIAKGRRLRVGVSAPMFK